MLKIREVKMQFYTSVDSNEPFHSFIFEDCLVWYTVDTITQPLETEKMFVFITPLTFFSVPSGTTGSYCALS